MVKKAEIYLEYQPYFDFPAQSRQGLYQQAASNDDLTVQAWRSTWIRNIKANKARFGSFKDHGLGKLHGTRRNQAAVLVGSGPSLKENAHELADRRGIPVVSCLHNFHFLEDLGVGADYYVSLDAGPVVIEEVSEGGTKTPDEYWALTKDRKLLCYIATDPALLEKWQGEVYFFNAPLPDQSLMEEIDKIETFRTFVSSGGNVLGACAYIAKGFLGCHTLVFTGANFSFSYTEKFHGWDSKYDANLGLCVKLTDVYGNKVKTWQSYANFKAWFDWLVQTVPGLYINASEGGCFGSYPEGNIRALRQMDLKDVLKMFNMCDELKAQCENPEIDEKKILF
ncbi:MAG: 6-hydroxymethylpterin diphosphokinase MptE-like protein [Pseudomonadota bacterium]